MNVPYLDLKRQHAALKEEMLTAVAELLDRCDFVLGGPVRELEERFAAYCGVRFAVGVNSGTDALILSLRALGVGPGDEVITVANSFLATASAIVAIGAQPVFVDIGADLNMNPDLLAGAITDRTRAILPVHLTGRVAAMDPILALARERDLPVVEDAAQAIGAEYRGKRAGSFGAAGCFSLHPLKTLNACGDGGVITTDDEALYDRLRQLHNIGLKSRNKSDLWGINSRLDSMQAALVCIKFKHLDAWIEKRRENAAFYTHHLGEVVTVPREDAHEKPAYHVYMIQTDRRDALADFLIERGIDVKIHYPLPIHRQKATQDLIAQDMIPPIGDLPATERAADRILSLPIHQYLTPEQLGYVVEGIRAFSAATTPGTAPPCA